MVSDLIIMWEETILAWGVAVNKTKGQIISFIIETRNVYIQSLLLSSQAGILVASVDVSQ